MTSTDHRPTPDEIYGQKLTHPASQEDMNLALNSDLSNYPAAEKLAEEVAMITGGDSGMGRAVAIARPMEGACVVSVSS